MNQDIQGKAVESHISDQTMYLISGSNINKALFRYKFQMKVDVLLKKLYYNVNVPKEEQTLPYKTGYKFFFQVNVK